MQSQGQLDCIKRQYQLNWDTIELAPAICPGAAPFSLAQTGYAPAKNG